MAASMAKSYLVRHRDDKPYDSFYSSTDDQAKQYTNDPVLPRYKHRVNYCEVFDFPIGEISGQCDQDSLALPTAIEELLIKANSRDVNMKSLNSNCRYYQICSQHTKALNV